MGCAHRKNQDGFTLVEISIVMIIIGLLIGGTFGGMKLIENMQVNKTVQDLKAIESAALTFRDTYGRLPGDMPNTAARLPSCTDAPCATGGNGDRRIGTPLWWVNPITDTSENFTFWHHLRAADIVSLEIKNTLDMSFGEGQPNSPMGDGLRVTDLVVTSTDGCRRWDRSLIWIQGDPSGTMGPIASTNCGQMASVDRKLDDGLPNSGVFVNSPQTSVGACAATTACDSTYRATGVGFGIYDLRGF
jgi:prepilin-type N-terminal cleavage/methylation domain-containing protein